MDKKKETGRLILRSHRIGRIANMIAEKLSISPVEATYSGRSPFTFSGDIRSLSRWFHGAKLILFS